MAFERYIGIDYSAAETCESGLKGLPVYMADRANEPREIAPPPSPRWYWSRKEIGQWLVERLSEPVATLVDVDHGFSFPSKYFEKYRLPTIGWLSWMIFKSIGPRTRSTRALISFGTARAETARLAVVNLAGDGSQNCVQARNPCFISTCPAP